MVDSKTLLKLDLTNKCLSKTGKEHAQNFLAFRENEAGNCDYAIKNHEIVLNRHFVKNRLKELKIIEKGNFRKLEQDLLNTVNNCNSAKDSSLIEDVLVLHEKRVKKKFQVLKENNRQKSKENLTAEELEKFGMVRRESTTSSFRSTERDHHTRTRS